MSSYWGGSILRALRPRVAGVVVLAVVVGGVVLGSQPRQAVAAGPPTKALTTAQAMRLASTNGNNVEIEEKTTEFTRTFATPQGTLSSEVSNTPTRVKRGESWIPLDASLQARTDGTVAPKAGLTDVVFSGGGTGLLARFKDGGKTFELKSPWTLPAPTLSGPTASYAEILPGVDLVMVATEDGFSYNLVVKNRAAAENPALRALRFPVTTESLALRTSLPGRPRYVDTDGRAVVSVGDAMMWDSSGAADTPNRGKAVHSAAKVVTDGPQEQAARAPMELTGDVSGLTVKPNQELLADPATVYPVVLDPTLVGSTQKNAWTAVWELYPNNSFWKTEHSLGVGYEGFEQSKIVRSFFQFDVRPFASKRIITASLRTYETHSASCTARRVVVTRTGPITAATTWNKQPSGLADVAYFDGAKGWSSACPPGNVEFDVTGSVQYTSTNNWQTSTFRLRAATENDELGWKQFNSTAVLTVEYVGYPLPAYDLRVASVSDAASPCAPSNDPSIISSIDVDLSAKGKVTAGGSQASVIVEIQIVSPAGSIWTMRSAATAPDVKKTLSPGPGISKEVLYRYHARTRVPIPGGELVSGWSGDCYFKIDLTPPPAPKITASYNGSPLTPCPADEEVGCPPTVPFGAKVTYTISSTSTDVVALYYGFNGHYTRASGRSVTVALETPGQTRMTLLAKSQDAADHYGPIAIFAITVGPGLPPVGAWALDEMVNSSAPDSSGKNHPLAVAGADGDDAGRIGKSFVFNGVGDHATATAPVVDTSKNFTLSAWARLTELSEGAVVGIFGNQGIAAQLYYSQSANRWLFMQHVADSTVAAQNRAASLQPPLLHTWTHLLGVYNAGTKTMTLYVNGRAQSSATFTNAPWTAAGPLELGWFKVGSNHGAAFTGSIDDVKVYPRILSAAEAAEVANPRVTVSGADEPAAELSAEYKFNETSKGADQVWRTKDEIYGADLALNGFGTDPSAAITEDDVRGSVLSMTGGVGQGLSIGRPVVDASASFALTAWIKLNDTSQPRVIARQAGTNKDSWRLEYRPYSSTAGLLVFARADQDTAAGVVTEVSVAVELETLSQWGYIAAVYDAARKQIAVRYSKNPQDTGFASLPIRTGSTAVGGGASTVSSFAGSIDDLRIYAGERSQRLLCIDVDESEELCS